MGYLTTITIYNDALHVFEKHPEEFGNAVFEGIRRANRERVAVSVGMQGYANYIDVQPSRHADDHTVYIHHGNCVFNLNAWNDDFRNLIAHNPEYAKDLIRVAKKLIKEAEEKLKETEKVKKA